MLTRFSVRAEPVKVGISTTKQLSICHPHKAYLTQLNQLHTRENLLKAYVAAYEAK